MASSATQHAGGLVLHAAAACGDLALLQRRQWLRKLCINWGDAEGRTPLHFACANGHVDVVQFLLRKKCKLNPRDNRKNTPLMKAVVHKQEGCVVLLLEHGADPNVTNHRGNTALHLAVHAGSVSVAGILLQHNARIDAQNEMGCTPLALAVSCSRKEMIEFLLEKGANVNARDRSGRSICAIAAVAGDTDMIRLLLRHGADPFKKDFTGKSAKDYFKEHHNKDLNEILEEAASSVIPGESPGDAAKGTAVPEGSCPVTTDYVLLLSTEYDEFGDEGEDGGFNAEGSAKEEENLPQRQDPETRLHFRDNTQGSAKEEENLPQRQDPETRLHFRDNTQGSAKEEENLPQRQDPETRLHFRDNTQGSAKEKENLPQRQDPETRLHFRDNTQGVVRQLPQELPGAPEEQPKSKASLEDPMHHHGRLKEEKRRLQKELDKYKAKLLRSQQQYIERLNYGVGLQIAIEKMEREVTASCVKQQSVLVASAAAAVIKHLEERVQRLEAQNARLEATAQQQAMIIEALQKELQASASSPPNCQSAVMR
ncbi:uncharacterized protein [Anas platyrhynchos]|uniref:uncharacterized protein isoform X2 n=1 Tax=Anas platyrhynchos TaxID=8839 RepID=UPI003AF22E20